MLASVSHELRTPLNCSINMLEVLGEYISEELKTNFLNPALLSNKLLNNIINDILDFSLIENKQFKYRYVKFNFSLLLKECFEMIQI